MQWLRVITISYLAPKNNLEARVKIHDGMENKSVVFPRSYDKLFDEQAFEYLQERGIKIEARGYQHEKIIVMTNDINSIN